MIKKFNVEKTRQLGHINNFLRLLYRKPRNKCKRSFKDVENVLIIDFALIGDMIMNIPFIEAIKTNCPRAKITMICMPWAKVILGDQALVDEFVIFDGINKLSSLKKVIENIKEIINTIKTINKKHYDIGFEPKGDLRHTLLLHYFNCDRTISYNYTGGDFLITDSYTPKYSTRHLIDEKLDLLEMSGLNIKGLNGIPRLKLSNEWKIYTKEFAQKEVLNGYYVVGVHPGASNKNKQYTHYPEIVQRINRPTIKFLIFEGTGEKDIVDNVCEKLNNQNYIRVKKSLKEYISLVSLCDYMICNDSAAGHIAAAYGIPVTVVFGPITPETALPRSDSNINYISHSLDCKPCTLPVCPLGTNECIESIGLDEVVKAVNFLLDNNL